VRTTVNSSDDFRSAPPPLPARLDPRAGRRGPARGDGTGAGADGRRRSGLGRLAVGVRVVAALMAVAVLGTSGWGWYLGEVADRTVNRTDAIPTEGNHGNGAAMNLLLVGSDSRVRLTEEQQGQLSTGADSGMNTDTMILAHVPADGSNASFVSFPRDSYVEIPGYGWDKLNAAYAYGYGEPGESASEPERQAAGAQLLIRTLSALTGLQIDHYAEVDLLGFFQLSNVIGGVEVNLCAPAQDSYSGIDLPAGPQTISGKDALAFVRQRHGLPRGDYDRIVRQQAFIGGMIRKMLSDKVLFDLGKQRELVRAAADSLTIDRNLDLLGLASQMQSITADGVEFQTVPYVGDERDSSGRYILRLEDQASMHQFFAELSADPEPAPEPSTETTPPPSAAPGEVTVEVFNGTGSAGLAGTAASALEGQGFGVAGAGNADSTAYTATEVRHAPGEEAMANAVLAAVPGAAVVEADDVPAGTVHLVLGSDFNGVGEAVTAVTETSEPTDATDDGGVEGEDAFTAADTGCIN
jgi:LCP family protein required for cell wall assembly